ncbi:hypothetical protein OROMI_019821 [Orobanche minor]
MSRSLLPQYGVSTASNNQRRSSSSKAATFFIFDSSSSSIHCRRMEIYGYLQGQSFSSWKALTRQQARLRFPYGVSLERPFLSSFEVSIWHLFGKTFSHSFSRLYKVFVMVWWLSSLPATDTGYEKSNPASNHVVGFTQRLPKAAINARSKENIPTGQPQVQCKFSVMSCYNELEFMMQHGPKYTEG